MAFNILCQRMAWRARSCVTHCHAAQRLWVAKKFPKRFTRGKIDIPSFNKQRYHHLCKIEKELIRQEITDWWKRNKIFRASRFIYHNFLTIFFPENLTKWNKFLFTVQFLFSARLKHFVFFILQFFLHLQAFSQRFEFHWRPKKGKKLECKKEWKHFVTFLGLNPIFVK